MSQKNPTNPQFNNWRYIFMEAAECGSSAEYKHLSPLDKVPSSKLIWFSFDY